MKKCPNCGAQIDNDSRFCAECGKEIPQGTVCPHCGAPMSDGDAFCQNCGKKPDDKSKPSIANPVRNIINEEKSSSFKKYLPYIVGAIAVLAIIGFFYSRHSKVDNTQDVAVDSLAERKTEMEEPKPTSSTNPFVGKVYRGGGNGGGLGINMRITFVDDKECLCVSDWYQAYSTDKQRRCAYEVKGNHVIIHVKDDGTEYDLDFDVKEDGRVLSFDKSDPSVGGTMGNDYMSLEIVDGNSAEEKTSTDHKTVTVDNTNQSSDNYYSSSSTSSSSRIFANEQYVVWYLANQTFRSSDGFTIRFDGSGRMYAEDDYAGVVSVLHYNSKSALLRYGGGQYSEGKIRVDIVGDDKLKLTDPVDGCVYYQR